jgi:hypothetical protein
MKNKNLLWILPVAMLLAGCGSTTLISSPAVSSSTPTTSSAASSSAAASSAAVSNTTTSSTATSSSASSSIATSSAESSSAASSSSSSAAASSSESVISSSSAATSSSTTSSIDVAPLLTITSAQAPAKVASGYPAAGTFTLAETTFAYDNIQVGGGSYAGTIQMKKGLGTIYNTTILSVSKIVVEQMDKEGYTGYLVATAGDSADPTGNGVVYQKESITIDGVAAFRCTYVFDQPYDYVALLADASYAVYVYSIALYA